MKHRFVAIGLALAATLAAACTQGGSGRQSAAVEACRVERLRLQPAAASDIGSLGTPPDHLTPTEVAATAACLAPALDAVLASAQDPVLRGAETWAPMSRAYRGSEHGMFLQVYANEAAAASYRRYEQGAAIPLGGTVLKRSFRVAADGKAEPYALFVMERMPQGFSPDTNDWRFALIGPDGRLVGATNGPDDAKVRYCASCHATARRQDFLLFVPPGLRL
ncbi:MAG: cytochrome P460 family protein [Telmatospirillum sp.]|nr:cytochrome P460 family protein [Telmatospirillum sp.]